MDKKYIKGIVCVVLIAIVAIAASMSGGDKTNSVDESDPFNGKDARLENVTVTSSYGFFSVNGKIMFKNDEVYASLAADVNLQDTSKVSESLVENWNDVKKDQWYKFDSSLLSLSGNDYSMSDIKSIDFKYNNEIIYTWENK